jgi:hypothetical protein
MKRDVLLAATAVVAAAFPGAAPARAQEPAAVYQQAPAKGFRFAGDGLARYEWTRDIPFEDGTLADTDRYRFQARPRVELNVGPFEAGVGGEFNYSEDENDVAANGGDPLLIRDNYRSRDTRLDLAYGRLKLGPVTAQGGRFLMPIPFTELVWDRDLRPQGGALTLGFGELTRFSLTGLYAEGSHVFEEESVMFGGAAELSIATGEQSKIQLVGSYLQWDDLEKLPAYLRRQNTRRLDGQLASEFQVVDLVGRLTSGGSVPVTLVADYCWNTAVDAENKGLWLSAVLGALGTSRLRLEYTYAKVDRDATVAAFNSDDFFWATGWEGHRVDVGTGAVATTSLHAIGQRQRFKDSPSDFVRDQWVTRFRLELRSTF